MSDKRLQPRTPIEEWNGAMLVLGGSTIGQWLGRIMIRLVNNKEAHLLFCRYIKAQIEDNFEHTHPMVLYRVIHWLTGTFNTDESDDILRRISRHISQETVDRHNELLEGMFAHIQGAAQAA